VVQAEPEMAQLNCMNDRAALAMPGNVKLYACELQRVPQTYNTFGVEKKGPNSATPPQTQWTPEHSFPITMSPKNCACPPDPVASCMLMKEAVSAGGDRGGAHSTACY
jgi:hypothetical protein